MQVLLHGPKLDIEEGLHALQDVGWQEGPL
jgi:hypothetical protein